MSKNDMRKKLLNTGCCFLFIIFLAGCASGPSSYFRLRTAALDTRVKVGIVSFTNLAAQRDANKKIAYALITHLLSTNYFDVIEIGEVQKAIKEAKVAKDADLSVDNIKEIGKAIGADVLLMGVVEEYKIDSSTMLGEKVFVPEVSISIRLVSTKDASIIWAANHHRRGDDRVTLFGMGRVDSISELTDIIIKNVARTLVDVTRKKRSVLSMLKEDSMIDEKVEFAMVTDSQTESVLGRDDAIKSAIKQAKEFQLDVSQESTKSIRQQIKDSYEQEYKKIQETFYKK